MRNLTGVYVSVLAYDPWGANRGWYSFFTDRASVNGYYPQDFVDDVIRSLSGDPSLRGKRLFTVSPVTIRDDLINHPVTVVNGYTIRKCNPYPL